MSQIKVSGNLINFVKIMEIIQEARDNNLSMEDAIDGIVKRFTIIDKNNQKK